MKRVVVLVMVAALVLAAAGTTIAVLLSAGTDEPSGTMRRGGATDGSEPDPQPAPSSDVPERKAEARKAPVAGLQTYYDQTISWEACGRNQCAWVEVPLDYAKPQGERIKLRMIKIAAGEPSRRIGSMVINPGGPGGSGVEYAKQADYAFGKVVRDRYDIVGFDPRGVGASAPIDCLTDAELDAWYAKDPTPDTPAEVAEAQRWSDRFGAGCVEHSGALAAHVSTVEAARDLDVIRAVLDESTLTYFGASYGTKLGATYADLFPKRSGRLVLDGAVDVSLTAREASLGQAGGFEIALRAYVDNCVKAGSCFLGADREAALDRITALLAELEAEPIKVGDRELTAGNAFYGIALPLYNRDYWVLLDEALRDVLDGDGAALLTLFDYYAAREGDGYADNSSEAIWAINCLDDSSSIPARKVKKALPEFEKASPTFGDIFAWDLVSCHGLAVPEAAKRPPLTAAGAQPLLVIGTTRDPATPYAWAQALAKQLDPAILVTRDGDGHTGYNMGNDCVDDVVENYLIGGTVPSADVTCPA
ncbi:alpha/beta hydrolase [Nocardioides sp. Bht2]|uniref:alpha/beta hydrolase n=1 Tax=Nocardioides sp. Bht2 TaxID=3392297 RepID=UPI0039B63B10